MKPRVKLTSNTVVIEDVARMVRTKAAGGTAIFVGTVREESEGAKISKMHLEAAKDLATKDISSVCNRALREHKLARIAVVHRIGDLRVGDVIVVIAVSAPHRKDAFVACQFIIDELKKTTPIWKKELGPKTDRWVH
ncbi:MAG TPA: molybdenum cofactor biosynthesis protein MoaE [Thermoplasmata archaeon]